MNTSINLRARSAQLAALVVCVLTFGVACASLGSQPWELERVESIQPGRTTQADITLWFGSPTSIRTNPDGTQVWTYRYRPAQAGLYQPPVSQPVEDLVPDALQVTFTSSGIVLIHELSRSYIELGPEPEPQPFVYDAY